MESLFLPVRKASIILCCEFTAMVLSSALMSTFECKLGLFCSFNLDYMVLKPPSCREELTLTAKLHHKSLFCRIWLYGCGYKKCDLSLNINVDNLQTQNHVMFPAWCVARSTHFKAANIFMATPGCCK